MDSARFEQLLVAPQATVRVAMAAIEAGAIEIALVVDDERRICGTLSDGDVRRALLAGASPDDGIDRIMNREPITAPQGTAVKRLLELMTEHGIEQVPLMSGDRVVDVAFIRDMLTRIPLSVPTLGEREALYLQQCIEERWVAGKGRFVREFEALFAERHGMPDALSVNTGTAALHVALAECGVGPGDEVIIPSLTFVASANPVLYLGATPVFADVDAATFTMDPASVEALITPRTRVLVVVHLFGHPADMDPLMEIAHRHGIIVVEDATEALGSMYKGRACGTLGHIAAFSFNGNKVITSGGGGMLLCADHERLRHMRHLTLQARVPGTLEYLHDELGYNYALSNLQAAVGLAQLEAIDERLAARRAIFERYASALDDVAGLSFTYEAPWARSNCWLMSVLVDEKVHGRDRERLMGDLDDAGIEARPFFTPLPDLPHLSHFRAHADVARDLHSRGVNIPSSADLGRAGVDRVTAELTGRPLLRR